MFLVRGGSLSKATELTTKRPHMPDKEIIGIWKEHQVALSAWADVTCLMVEGQL